MIHEIINPSDPYTIESDDMAVLTAAIFVLGEGAYATRSNDTDYEVPITIFGGNAAKYFEDNFNQSFEEFLNKNRIAIADTLDGVCIGSLSDRELFLLALSKMKEDEKESFKNEWYDKRQSSLNQIGQRAYFLAKRLREIEESENAKA